MPSRQAVVLTLISVLLATTLSACGYPWIPGALPAKQQQTEKRHATARAQNRPDDAKIFTDPKLAPAALQQRIEQAVTIEGQILYVQDFDQTWHAMPTSVPWSFTCNEDTVTMTLGPWSDFSDPATDGLIAKYLVSAKLTPQQCRSLVQVGAEKLRAMLSHG